MTFLELATSDDPDAKLKASIMSIKDFEDTLNEILSRPVPELNYWPASTNVSVEPTVNYLFTLLKTQCLTVNVKAINTFENPRFQLLEQLLGPSIEIKEIGNKKCALWSLPVSDWPFITLHLIGKSLKAQKANDSIHIPAIIEQFLPISFPELDYLQLLHWYKDDLFELESSEKGLPLLKDVTTMLLIKKPKTSVDLPPNFEF